MKNCKANLLSLINSSLEVVYYITILSNDCIIRFVIFLSRFYLKIWNEIYQLSIFNLYYKVETIETLSHQDYAHCTPHKGPTCQAKKFDEREGDVGV